MSFHIDQIGIFRLPKVTKPLDPSANCSLPTIAPRRLALSNARGNGKGVQTLLESPCQRVFCVLGIHSPLFVEWNGRSSFCSSVASMAGARETQRLGPVEARVPSRTEMGWPGRKGGVPLSIDGMRDGMLQKEPARLRSTQLGCATRRI